MPTLANERHEMFANEFVKDLNASQAAIRCGYSEKTARSQGSRLLTDANIMERISELKLERSERTRIDADYVLRRLSEIDQMDVMDILAENGEIKPVREWPKVWRTTLSGMDVSEINTSEGAAGLLKKIKWPDKVKNLELLGNHVNVQAFKVQTKTEVTGANGGPLVTREMSAEEAADAYKDLMG